jgi:hypothetical protein
MAMKILWLSTGTINCDPIIGSLESIKKPDWEITIHNYFTHGLDFTQHYDLILYISVSAGPHLPTITHLKEIKKHTSKFVHLCFDAACTDWHPLLELYRKEECFDVTINIDGNDMWPKGPRDFTWLAPIDPRYFIPTEKITECGFCGGCASGVRQEIISYLKDKLLITAHERVDAILNYNEYATFMCQCKMVVNMSQSGSGMQQVKARVIEAGLARACLFEPTHSVTSTWFTPEIDYVEYLDKEDLAYRIEVLKKRPEIVKIIANNLHKKVSIMYCPEVFWKKVFDASSMAH